MQIENHPLAPFVSPKTRFLLLGSFPPPQKRWVMDFYYPNLQNDMWRIMGLVFYDNKEHFISGKTFDLPAIMDFLRTYEIGVADTAYQVIRLNNNASDKTLKVATPLDIKGLLDKLSSCQHIAVTGEKALDTLLSEFNISSRIKTNEQITINYKNKDLTIYRLPSSSRAYPLAISEKAKSYQRVFKKAKILV